MLKPFRQGQILADEILEAKANGVENAFDIWWLGQSGFLIQWNKKLLLLDPYLSDSLTKKYAGTDKPHVRISEIVIDPELLKGIDIVTASHQHTDHLDGETLRPIFKSNPTAKFIIPEAHRNLAAERAGCDLLFPIGMSSGSMVSQGGFTFHGIPSAHNEIEFDQNGNCIFLGYVVQFGRWSLYHSGDTLRHSGLVDILNAFQIDVAFLPINGNLAERRVAGNLDAKEAAFLGREIGAKLVIPHHYDLFEFNTANPAEFEEHANSIVQPCSVMRLGERIRLGNREQKK
jgi:L-ascorbate metabolism protein UlaG (beta-lactamase superfamily)